MFHPLQPQHTSAANGGNKTAFVREQRLRQHTHWITKTGNSDIYKAVQQKQSYHCGWNQMIYLFFFLHMCMILYVLQFTSTLNHKRTKISQCDPVLGPIFTIRRMKRWIFGATLVYYSFTNTWGYSDSPIKLMPIFLSVGGKNTRRKPTQLQPNIHATC